ncbi:MAG: GH36-type glycosyl hydrolase domain-containing protein [Gammaproteobacteria bacterium]
MEPYVTAGDVYAEAPHVGRGGWTWYTGSASWMYRAAIEWILGVRFRGSRLHIDPCIPRRWRGFDNRLPLPLRALRDPRREPARRHARRRVGGNRRPAATAPRGALGPSPRRDPARRRRRDPPCPGRPRVNASSPTPDARSPDAARCAYNLWLSDINLRARMARGRSARQERWPATGNMTSRCDRHALETR